MFLKLLKKKEQKKKQELNKIRSKIKEEELKQQNEDSEFVLNINQINDGKSFDKSTRNNALIPPHLRVKMHDSDEGAHPLYTSILGSKKISSKSK